MTEWLRPILGAALLLAGAGGLAYKVISGYQHPSPDAFVSVHDQDKPSAASAVDHTAEGSTVPLDAAASAQGPASAAQSPASPPQSAPSAAQSPASPPQSAPSSAQDAASAQRAAPTTAPPAESGNTLAIASRAASNVALPAEAQDNPACVPIEAEQREIQGALKKPYSPEQGRFMQRRLRELAEQSVNLKCTE